MSDERRIDSKLRKQVVAAYIKGIKIREIEEQFDLQRGTIYWILEREGVTPTRARPAARMTGGDEQLAQLYAIITAQDQRIRELEELIEQARLDRKPNRLKD